MQARCPHCSSVFATERGGIQFCPNCGQQVDVPAPASSAAAPTPAPAPSSIPGSASTGGAGIGGSGGPPFGGGGSFGGGGFLPPGGSGARGPTPWERRKELGFFPAFFETWKAALTDPMGFFSSVLPEGPWVDGLLYAWIITAVTTVLTIPFSFMNQRMMQSMFDGFAKSMDGLPPDQLERIRTMTGGGGIAYSLCALIAYPLIFIIGVGIVHVCCLITGAGKNGYYATLRALAYSTAPQVFGFIPCVGFLSGLYALVLSVIGISKVHDTTLARAAFGVLLPLILLCCCTCGGAMLFGGAMMSALRH